MTTSTPTTQISLRTLKSLNSSTFANHFSARSGKATSGPCYRVQRPYRADCLPQQRLLPAANPPATAPHRVRASLWPCIPRMLHQDGLVCSAYRLAAHHRVPLRSLRHAIRRPTPGIFIAPSRIQHAIPGYCTEYLVLGLVSDLRLFPRRQPSLDAPGIWFPSLSLPC